MKIPPRPQKGILVRHCKNCGRDFESKIKSRYCRECRRDKNREARQKYYLNNKEKSLKATAEWVKANPEKNRLKARASYHRRRHLELLRQRSLGLQEMKKEENIRILKGKE